MSRVDGAIRSISLLITLLLSPLGFVTVSDLRFGIGDCLTLRV